MTSSSGKLEYKNTTTLIDMIPIEEIPKESLFVSSDGYAFDVDELISYFKKTKGFRHPYLPKESFPHEDIKILIEKYPAAKMQLDELIKNSDIINETISRQDEKIASDKKSDTVLSKEVGATVRIILIKQLHKIASNLHLNSTPNPQVIDDIVRSQFMVAQEIKKHPGRPIVLEGLCEDTSEGDTSIYLAISNAAKMLFPAGFPTDFNELTPDQKYFLYEEEAVWALFYLGEIPAIYKAIHKEAGEAIDRQISEGSFEQMMVPRELEVIECAKEAAVKHYNKLEGAEVLVVFGGGHNLKPYCDKEKFELEVINTFEEGRFTKPVRGEPSSTTALVERSLHIDPKKTTYYNKADENKKNHRKALPQGPSINQNKIKDEEKKEENSGKVIEAWLNAFDKNNGQMEAMDFEEGGAIFLLKSIMENDGHFKRMIKDGYGAKAIITLEKYAELLCKDPVNREDPNSYFRKTNVTGKYIYEQIDKINDAMQQYTYKI